MNAEAKATVRDHLSVGLGALAFGVVPAGFGVGLAVIPQSAGGTLRGAAVCALVAAPFILVGLHWVSRRVTLTATELRARTWLGERVIRTHDVTSIRVGLGLGGTPAERQNSGSRMVVRDERGTRITVSLGSRAAIDAAREWFPPVADVIAARWRRELAAGRTVDLGRRTRLVPGGLEHRGKRIDLAQPFTLEEVPGLGAAPLLRVDAGEVGVELDGDMDNYVVLLRCLRAAQSTGGTSVPA